MNLANKITTARIILVPVFLIVLLMGYPIPALIIFIVASLTDFVDGQIARRCNMVTSFGKFLDPLADKLLVTSALLVFVEWGQMPSWAAMIIIAREFAVTGLRLVAASEGVVIAAAWSGKIKTASSLAAIRVMLTPLYKIAICGSFTVNALCVVIMVLTTVVSGVEYFAKNGKMLKAK